MIGDLLKQRREHVGWTVTQAAQSSGLNYATVIGIETGLGVWSSARKLAEVYGKRLRLSVNRSRKDTIDAIAERANVSAEVVRAVLALSQTPNSDFNPKVSSVESVLDAVGGSCVLQ